jgi:hypothetical protein
MRWLMRCSRGLFGCSGARYYLRRWRQHKKHDRAVARVGLVYKVGKLKERVTEEAIETHYLGQ